MVGNMGEVAVELGCEVVCKAWVRSEFFVGRGEVGNFR